MARTGSKGFYTLRGERVPSVTTIIGTNLGWDKNALIAWARKEGLAGRDAYKVRDEAGSIGSLTHLMIQQFLQPPVLGPFQINFDEWTPEQQTAADRGFTAFKQWLSHYKYTTIFNEKSLVSEKYRFGGALDWVVVLDDKAAYVDFKTSKGIYPGHRIQVAAYIWLYHENFDVWLEPHLLQLGKEDGSFHHHPLVNLQPHWEVFQHLLELNRLKEKIDP
jgi:hypothetical protein